MPTLPRNDDGARRAPATPEAGRGTGLASLATLTAAAAAATTDTGRSAGTPALQADGGVRLSDAANSARMTNTTDMAERPTLAELVDQVIDHFDADADGAISAEELAIAVDASGRFGDLVSRLASHGLLVDSDADGLITADELSSALADSEPHLLTGTAGRPRVGHDQPARDGDSVPDATGDHGTSQREPVTVADAASTLFNAADADADAALSVAEVLTLIDTQPTTINFDALVNEAFKRIDADADQRLTLQEVTTAITQFDANGDGLLVMQELGPHAFDQLSVELIGLLVHKFSDIGCGDA